MIYPVPSSSLSPDSCSQQLFVRLNTTCNSLPLEILFFMTSMVGTLYMEFNGLMEGNRRSELSSESRVLSNRMGIKREKKDTRDRRTKTWVIALGQQNWGWCTRPHLRPSIENTKSLCANKMLLRRISRPRCSSYVSNGGLVFFTKNCCLPQVATSRSVCASQFNPMYSVLEESLVKVNKTLSFKHDYIRL